MMPPDSRSDRAPGFDTPVCRDGGRLLTRLRATRQDRGGEAAIDPNQPALAHVRTPEYFSREPSLMSEHFDASSSAPASAGP